MKVLLTTTAAALVLLAAGAVPAGAQTGSCGVGPMSPTCQFWTGKVTFIGDGDTVSVKLAGTPKKAPSVRVRLTGIQAMEEYVYTTDPKKRRGECHANEATARLEHLVKASKGRVRLAAQDPSSRSGGRLRRQVSVLVNGRWRDVGRILMSEGHAIPLANSTEWAWNASYFTLAQRAATQHIGIWNSSYCGVGPEELANLRLFVNWPGDATGSAPRTEWVKIKNLDPVNAVPLGGWWVRDSALRRYTLPPTASVPPGGTLTVHVAQGTDTPPADFSWGIDGPIFDDPDHSGHGVGDGAYLFDPQGDLRQWMIYPCRVSCTDPLQNALELSAHPRGSEYVNVKNVSSGAIDLEGYRLVNGRHGYPFPAPSVLQPGETLRVNMGGSPEDDTPLVKNWGQNAAVLYNSGGSVRVMSYPGIVLACDSWGSGSCS